MIYKRLASYYDQFVDDKLTNIYIDLIIERFNKGTVVDLGCGTGPLAIRLAQKGFTVTATDISESMLEIAYSNAMRENVDIKFSVHNILYPLNNNYDIITMSSDVINYLDNKEEVLIALRNIEEIMNKNSIFVFDALKLKYLNDMVGYNEQIELDDLVLKWEVNETPIMGQISHKITIEDESEYHFQTAYEPEEYLKMLEESNLRLIKQVDYDERIIYICKKEL